MKAIYIGLLAMSVGSLCLAVYYFHDSVGIFWIGCAGAAAYLGKNLADWQERGKGR